MQKFNVQIAEDETILIWLKWVNADEVDQAFKDQQEDYLLKLVVSY